MNNSTEQLRAEIFCCASDRRTFEQLGFSADPEFRATNAALMIHVAANQPLVAALLGIATDGMVLLGYVVGSKHHPPAAIASDGMSLEFVPCDHGTFDPIVRVTRDGTVIGIEQARAFWRTAVSASDKLGLSFGKNTETGENV